MKFSVINQYVQEISADLKRIRRHLHSHPELGREEYQTSALLRDELHKSGDFEINMVGDTGFCSDLKTDVTKQWVAMRGDMDALPIPDKKRVSYRSTVAGVCHACGHDFHSTVTLGVAKVLSNFKKNLSGNVRFIFQHAEEPTPGGAIDFVKAGKLDSINAIFGLHADPTIAAGSVRIVPGWITAQSIHVIIDIKGPGGHSARPYETSDPVYIGNLILGELYSAIYRFLKAETPYVFSVGIISAGKSYNSISDSFHAEGTLRVTDEKQGDQLLAYIDKTVKGMCSKWGAQGSFNFMKGAQPVINDPQLTNTVNKIISSILVEDDIISQGRTLGGEDFAQFLHKTAGLFLRVGVGNNKKALLHSGYFDIDEQSISFAVGLFSWIIIKYLAKLNRNGKN